MTATYVKLQDAHAAEVGAVGSWQMIGYIAPGSKVDGASKTTYSTTVFDYTDEFSPADATKGTTMVGDLGANSEGWRATAKTALNDCKIQSYWNIVMNKAGQGASVSYKADMTAASGGNVQDCKSLTANFANIGHD